MRTKIMVDGVEGELLDISVAGIGVRLPTGLIASAGKVSVELPGADAMMLEIVRISTVDPGESNGGYEFVALRVADNDMVALGALTVWMFHTPVTGEYDPQLGRR